MPEWIDVKTAARRLDIAERTVRDRIRKGKLIAKKEGNHWLVDAASIGNIGGNETAMPAAESAITGNDMITIPLDRYEGLLTKLGQMQAENESYRLALEAHEEKRGWWKRIFRKR